MLVYRISTNSGSTGGADKGILIVQTPIAALTQYGGDQGTAAGAGGEGGVRLHLLDTPGPNEAGEDALRFQVRGGARSSGLSACRSGWKSSVCVCVRGLPACVHGRLMLNRPSV